jgi:hypothetical protein
MDSQQYQPQQPTNQGTDFEPSPPQGEAFQLHQPDKKLWIYVLVGFVIAGGAFGFYVWQRGGLVPALPMPTPTPMLTPTPTISQIPSEDALIKQLLFSWIITQSNFSSKAGESGTYNQPSKVQFIANDTLLAYYDDGLVDHISILQFKNGAFVELKNVGVMSTMSLDEWQTLVMTYGSQNFSVSNYITSILKNGLKNGQLVNYEELTKVSENVFVRDTTATPTLPTTCVDQQEGKPVITSLSIYSGLVGTKLEIRGCNFSGFEGDKSAWIENSQGINGILYGETGSTAKLLEIILKSPLCQQDNSYSGLPCNAYLTLTPGTYKIYTMPWGKKSNTATFTIQ